MQRGAGRGGDSIPGSKHLFGYRARTIQIVGIGPNREPREGVTIISATLGRGINAARR